LEFISRMAERLLLALRFWDLRFSRWRLWFPPDLILSTVLLPELISFHFEADTQGAGPTGAAGFDGVRHTLHELLIRYHKLGLIDHDHAIRVFYFDHRLSFQNFE
jgi:hypothetical protein